LLYDIIFETNKANIPGLVISIDFEKAFDSISINFIQKSLAAFGFGQSIQNWVKLLYKNMSAYVIQNGHISKNFSIKRGCRQGDPIAPYIFLISLQTLIYMIKENKDIKGVTINGVEHKQSFYADDGLIFLDGSETSLQTLLDTLNTFSHISGLKINIEKTKAIWIGKNRGKEEKICKNIALNWTKGEFTVLGIVFNTHLHNLTEINLKEKIQTIKNLLEQWKRRNLTLMGKITVIKALAVSKITHILMALPNPSQDTIKSIDNIFYKFLWNNGPDKVKRNLLIQEYADGGLKMIDLKSFIQYLKANWLKRAVKKSYRWSTVSFMAIVETRDDDFGRYGVSAVKPKRATPNIFWQNVLEAWKSIEESFATKNYSIEEILSEPLWHNKHLKSKCTLIKNWVKAGILFVKDILDGDGTFLSFEQMRQKYQIRGTFLDFERVKRNIPTEWISLLPIYFSTVGSSVPIPKLVKIILSPSKQTIYKLLVKSKLPALIKGHRKWEDTLGPEKNWRHVHQSAMLATKSTYLRSLHYKIINRFLCTNRILQLMKLRETDECSFCHGEKETIAHMFTECTKIIPFWKCLQNWYQQISGEKIDLNTENILLGVHPQKKLQNLVILVAKALIYRSRIKEQKPSMTRFLHDLRSTFQSERYDAYVTQCYYKHTLKWSRFMKYMMQNSRTQNI